MDPGDGGLSRAYIIKAVDRSLKRLQTDYIDLYQAHRDDENTPLEETLSAYAELIKQGKVRAIGGSNYTAKRLAEVLKVAKDNDLPRYETMQPWYNMYDRKDFEGRAAGTLRQGGYRRHPLFRARQRLPFRQIPQARGRRRQAARLSHRRT